MTERTVSLLGMGAIGQSILAQMARSPIDGFRIKAVCARPHQIDLLSRTYPDILFVDDIAGLLADPADVIVEAAGQSAVAEFGNILLESCQELQLLSVGALADDVLRDTLRDTAARCGARIILPAGALAGLDGLRAIRNLDHCVVRYVSRKPPAAWAGTPAETLCALDHLTVATEFFRGTARDAARLFPKNANLAATVALAGVGFDRTEVALVADPDIADNIGRLEAHAIGAAFHVETVGHGFSDNPKSSRITGMSVIAALTNSNDVLSFG